MNHWEVLAEQSYSKRQSVRKRAKTRTSWTRSCKKRCDFRVQLLPRARTTFWKITWCWGSTTSAAIPASRFTRTDSTSTPRSGKDQKNFYPRDSIQTRLSTSHPGAKRDTHTHGHLSLAASECASERHSLKPTSKWQHCIWPSTSTLSTLTRNTRARIVSH